MFPFFNHYPGTDLHEIDLAYILKLCAELQASNTTLEQWKATHEQEYAELEEKVEGLIHNLVDVISPWDSSIAYHIFSIVEYQGTNYIAVQDVPIGTMITNTDYWQPANTITEQINAIGVVTDEANSNAEEALELSGDAIEIANSLKDTLGGLSPAWSDIGAIDKDTKYPDGQINGSFYYSGTLYQYVHTTGISGYFIPINMTDGTFGTNIAVNAYHGNDFVIIGSRVYAAPYDDGNNHGVNKIISFDINNPAVITQITVDTEYDCLYAIDKLDDDNLLCMFRTYGVNNVNGSALYKYTISTGTTQEITIDWSGLNYLVNSFPHPILYRDGYIYLSASFETGIYTLRYDNDALTAKVVGYNSMPRVNNNNAPLNELESLCFADEFPDYIIVGITGRTLGDGQDWTLFEGIRLNGRGAKNLVGGYNAGDGSFNPIHVNEIYNAMFENGSQSLPFKRGSRAAYACKGTVEEVEGTLTLDTDLSHQLVISGITLGIAANQKTIAGLWATRAKIFIAGKPTFSAPFRIYSGTEVNITTDGAIYNAAQILENTCSLKEGPSTHNGTITVTNSTYDLASANPATDTLNMSTSFNSLIKLNRNSTTGIAFGGGL